GSRVPVRPRHHPGAPHGRLVHRSRSHPARLADRLLGERQRQVPGPARREPGVRSDAVLRLLAGEGILRGRWWPVPSAGAGRATMSRSAGRGASSQAGTGFETEGAGHVRGGSLRAAVAGTGAADGTVARGDPDAFDPERGHGAGRGAGGRLRPAGLVEPQAGAAPGGMRAGPGVAAADQVVELRRGTAPVDPGVRVAAERVVARARLVLRDARRPAL